jgi:hypothetical protein
MDFDEAFKKIAILFILLRNGENFLLVDELILIEKCIRNDRHIEILILFIFFLLLVIVFMVNLQKTQWFNQAEPS